VITQAQAHELFEYRDGVLIWKVRPSKWGHIYAGDIAGTPNMYGYCQIRIDGRFYRRSRLIFFMFNGFWPKNQIDHIDRDRSNDRIENLRDVTSSQNKWNTKKYDNAKGCHWIKSRRKWHAQIRINGKQTFLGYHDTEAEARTAYLAARIEYHGKQPCQIRSERRTLKGLGTF
jgi:hypothetical protein